MYYVCCIIVHTENFLWKSISNGITVKKHSEVDIMSDFLGNVMTNDTGILIT